MKLKCYFSLSHRNGEGAAAYKNTLQVLSNCYTAITATYRLTRASEREGAAAQLLCGLCWFFCRLQRENPQHVHVGSLSCGRHNSKQ